MPLTRPTTTPLPDEIYDLWVPQLGAAELKVLLYVVRRTLGFRKTTDAISLSQFTRGIVTTDGRVLDYGCGVRNRSNVVRALKSLETRGLIQVVPGRTASGDQGVTTYALWWVGDKVVAARDSGGPETGPGGSAGTEPGWSCSEQKVVPEEDHGGAAAGPTTNSIPTNSQQNSLTTGGSSPHLTMVSPSRPTREQQPSDTVVADGDALWGTVLASIRPYMTADNYNQWFDLTRVLDAAPGELTIGVPDRVHRHWLDVRLRRRIEEALSALGQADVCVRFEVSAS